MFEQVCNQKPLLVRELRFGFVPGPRRSRLGFTVTGSLALHWPTPFRAPPMQSNCQLPQKSDLKLVLIIEPFREPASSALLATYLLGGPLCAVVGVWLYIKLFRRVR